MYYYITTFQCWKSKTKFYWVIVVVVEGRIITGGESWEYGPISYK